MNMLESKTIHCPYCGAANEILVDRSLTQQCYIEDCTVCCRPMTLEIHCEPKINIIVRRDDD